MLDLILLTTDDDETEAAEVKLECMQAGLPQPFVYKVPRLPKKAPKSQVDSAIHSNHGLMWKHWLDSTTPETRKNRNLMLLENDCVFVRPDMNGEIESALAMIRASNPDWQLLMVGQLAVGPMIRSVIAPHIYYSHLPCTSHAYVLNGNHVQDLYEIGEQTKWKQPFLVEKWTAVPLHSKFAFHPTMAVQSRPPRAYLKTGPLSNVDFVKFTGHMNEFMVFIPVFMTSFAAFAIILVGVIICFSLQC